MTPIKFKEIRKGLGLNQTQLAKAMDVAKETVWRWEHGRIAISEKVMTTLFRLAGQERCPACGKPVPQEETDDDEGLSAAKTEP